MGDLGRLGELYDAHAGVLFGYLMRLLKEEADARDVLQEVLQKLVDKPQALAAIKNERSFFLRMAHHAVVDLVRARESRKRRYEAIEAEHGGVTWGEGPDRTAMLHEVDYALSLLPRGRP